MKTIINFLITGLIVFILAYLLPGVTEVSFWGALVVALVLGILNIFIRPLLVFFTLPATIVTFGLFLWVINALIILVASWLLKDIFHVDGFWWALLFALLMSLIQSVAGYENKEKKRLR
ncbi:MAG: phage holin family protein [Weeksellaceae bacterium]